MLKLEAAASVGVGRVGSEDVEMYAKKTKDRYSIFRVHQCTACAVLLSAFIVSYPYDISISSKIGRLYQAP